MKYNVGFPYNEWNFEQCRTRKTNKKYAHEKYDKAYSFQWIGIFIPIHLQFYLPTFVVSVYLTTYIFSCRQINYKFLSSCCDYIEMGVYIQDIYGTYHHEKPDTEGFIRVISILKISSGVKTFTFDIDLDSELMMVPTV